MKKQGSNAHNARLNLETSRPSATTGPLELATLAGDSWFLVGVGSEAEVLDGLAGVLWSSEEEGVCSGWGALRKLLALRDDGWVSETYES